MAKKEWLKFVYFNHGSDISDFKSRFNLQEFARNNFDCRESGSKLYILCPFHSEATPSCLVDTNRYYCYGCHAKGDSIEFLQRHLSLSIPDILDAVDFEQYCSKSKLPNKTRSRVASISQNLINAYHKLLLEKPCKIEYLESRSLDIDSIRHAHIGWGYPTGFKSYKLPRYVIPVYDQNGKLVNARYRIDPLYDNNSEPKYIGFPNAPNFLYNSHILSTHDNILIVGSELDAAFLYFRYGIAAVAPPGENVFKESWAKLFRGKNILLWLDSDIAGKNGMLYAYGQLKPFAQRVKIYKWQLGLPHGYDVGDYVKDNGMVQFIDELVSYELE